MRNQPLTGYLLHHKPYQENRALYYFFTPTHGLVHGVGKKGIPLFSYIQLFATGKRSLKSFSQTNLLESKPMLSGQNLYAGYYLNEVLWKLLEHEDQMPKLWQYYQYSLEMLHDELTAEQLRLLLRYFEKALFDELGYGFYLTEDTQGQAIEANSSYRFIVDEGFQRFYDKQASEQQNGFSATSIFRGASLLSIAEFLTSTTSTTSTSTTSEASTTAISANINDKSEQASQTLTNAELQDWSRLHKQMIDFLLDYQPLKSRELWRQSQRYR